ncbi:MAG: hypothetical protein O7C67_05010, partial [Gammaproteobacteria bacterium]|nr:hypothetical protein [Gammaproteobacteria bacterium]
SREWPKRFPPVAVPDGFALIGSRTSSHLSMISFKSPSSVEDARVSLKLAMTDAEWQQPEYTRPTVAGGFQSSRVASIRSAASFCHDDHGHMSALFSEAPSGATYITLMGSAQRSPGQCNLMQRMMSSRFTGSEAMPQLTLPDDATGAPGLAIGGISSSGGGNATTRIQLETSLSSTALVDFFGNQLAAQHWQEEAQWAGSRVSGSAWISEDAKTSGLLRVIEQQDNQYKLDFQITQHR